MSMTHRGEVLVSAIGTGQGEDDRRPEIPIPLGYEWTWNDVTGTPPEAYTNPDPSCLVVYIEANSEGAFLALGDDVLWYEEIPQEAI